MASYMPVFFPDGQDQLFFMWFKPCHTDSQQHMFQDSNPYSYQYKNNADIPS